MKDKPSNQEAAPVAPAANSESPKASEVSAVAIARMMGVATNTELKILEGKLDLVSTHVTNISAKVERVMSMFTKMPTGSDLERIDVQIGAVKAMIRDLLSVTGADKLESGKGKPAASTVPVETEIITSDQESAE